MTTSDVVKVAGGASVFVGLIVGLITIDASGYWMQTEGAAAAQHAALEETDARIETAATEGRDLLMSKVEELQSGMALNNCERCMDDCVVSKCPEDAPDCEAWCADGWCARICR